MRERHPEGHVPHVYNLTDKEVENLLRRPVVRKRPAPYLEKLHRPMDLPQVRQLGGRLFDLVDSLEGLFPVAEDDKLGLGRSYERRGLRNLGSVMLDSGDIMTAAAVVRRLEEMEQGRFNIRRMEELALKQEIKMRLRKSVRKHSSW